MLKFYIRRMLILAIMAFAFAGCKPAPVTLQGSAFIVTEGGVNYKLGLVEVRAFNSTAALPALAQSEHALNEKSKKLSEAIAQAARREKEINDEINPLKAALKKAEFDPSFVGSSSGRLQELLRHAELLSQELLNERLLELLRKQAGEGTGKKIIHCMELAELLSASGILKTLPQPVSIAKTDADGRFQMTLEQGDYVIAALARRQVASGHGERYAWFIPLHVQSDTPASALMLSNDNLAASGTKASLIQIGRLPAECD
ncbi:hypothetical protein H9L17_15445 [Thermomonas brevis]|uniref:Uncharacterized protein n=1 Tax=Thermomonas brevis TaxID=215691 RepID=A0A7G9QT57_9GAMM|nr:hypothetical protein [Thermomonas brevis]QNN46532.1 hypothetical protein H9L17_15445 [Thermomonas brevis]